jgi:hypothetical protein
MGSDLEAIRADSGSGTITWSNVWVRNWNALNNGSSAFYGVLGNTVNPAATTADPENGHGAPPYAGTWTLAGIRTPTVATGFTGIGTLFPLNRLQIKGAAVGGETAPDWQLRLSKNFARANGLGAGPGIILAHQADNSFEGVADAANQKRAGIAAPAEDAAFSKVVGLGFWTSNTDSAFTEKMRISGRGAVGIGTTAPASLLHLNDATRPTLTISDSALSRSRLFRPTTSQVNLAHNASFDGVGWTLDDPAVGGSSVSVGDSGIQFNQWTAGSGYRSTSTPLQISATGIVTLGLPNYAGCTSLTTNASGVLGCTISTAKYKENFAGFTRGLQAIRLIVPQTFSWQPTAFAADGGKTHLGLIAENLETANPLLVSRRGDGDLQPEPLALHAIQIDAIKTLDARITALEKSFATAQRELAIYRLLAEAGVKPSECGPPANPFACVREDPKTGLLSVEKRTAKSKE